MAPPRRTSETPTETEQQTETGQQPEGIDYSGDAATVREAKDRAHDADRERLQQEHETA